MQLWMKLPGSCAKRLTAIGTLAVFLVGCIGIPLAPHAQAGRAPAAVCRMVPGKSCCCAKAGSATCACRCCQHPPRDAAAGASAKAGKRTKNAEDQTVPMVSCPCNGAPADGFFVSVQPRLTTAVVSVPLLAPTDRVAAALLPQASAAELAPETPPPRRSAC
jgi:hypothetical protein